MGHWSYLLLADDDAMTLVGKRHDGKSTTTQHTTDTLGWVGVGAKEACFLAGRTSNNNLFL